MLSVLIFLFCLFLVIPIMLSLNILIGSNKKSDLGELKDAKVPKFLKNYKK